MTTDKPRRRTFTVDRPRDGSVEFTLEFQARNMEVEDEDADEAWTPAKAVIRCIQRAPGGLLLDFLSGGDAESFGAIDRFLTGVIDRRDLAEYRRIVTDPDVMIPIETLAEVVGWLVEVYAARPTEPPSA